MAIARILKRGHSVVQHMATNRATKRKLVESVRGHLGPSVIDLQILEVVAHLVDSIATSRCIPIRNEMRVPVMSVLNASRMFDRARCSSDAIGRVHGVPPQC